MSNLRMYFAGPLFSDAERAFNLKLTARIEALGFEVFLPQRDGVESSKPPYDKMSKEERRFTTFTLDRDAIYACDIFLIVLDGRVPDEGACVELGLAYAHKELVKQRWIYGLHTDSRAAFLGSKLNPMLSVALDMLCENEESLIERLKTLVST